MFTLNDLAREENVRSLYDLDVRDDRGRELHPLRMVPVYGGFGNNAPTAFITIRGRKALFAESVAQNSLQYLRLEWEA